MFSWNQWLVYPIIYILKNYNSYLTVKKNTGISLILQFNRIVELSLLSDESHKCLFVNWLSPNYSNSQKKWRPRRSKNRPSTNCCKLNDEWRDSNEMLSATPRFGYCRIFFLGACSTIIWLDHTWLGYVVSAPYLSSWPWRCGWDFIKTHVQIISVGRGAVHLEHLC